MTASTGGTARGFGLRVALALASTILAVGVLEAAATLVLGPRFVRGGDLGDSWKIVGRPDPQMGWSGRPHARARVVHNRVDYSVRLNAHGFRDRERSVPKPPGVTRVVALGDSVTWGWGVNEGERFTDLLEARLEPGAEILNLACPGYGTDQQLWTLLERGLPFEPDAVLVCVILNDVHEVENLFRYKMRKPCFVRRADGTLEVAGRPVPVQARAPRGLWSDLLRHSALLHLSLHGAPAAATERPDEPPPLVAGGRATAEQLVDPEARALADKLADPASMVRTCLRMLRDACRERGLPLLVTHVPHKHDPYLYEPLKAVPERLQPEPYRSYVTQRLAEACAALELPFVPVDDAFLQRRREGVRLHVGDGHPNADGHRLVADRLEPALRALLAR